MTHQDEAKAYTSAFLKAKLEDRNPKCGNCKFWPGLADKRVQNCEHPINRRGLGLHIAAGPEVADLSLCSAWEKKEASA